VEGLENHVIRALLEARDGAMWIGTEAGLARWSNDSLTTFTRDDGLPSNFVYSVHEDEDGTLWLGTAQGLARYTEGGFQAFSSTTGLPVDLVFQILEDDGRNLWLSTQQGIVSVSKGTLPLPDRTSPGTAARYTRFDESDGMLSSECYGATQPAGLRTRDGRLLFPTYNGVAIVQPGGRNLDVRPPTAVVDRFVADGVAIDGPPPVVLPAGTEEVELHFTAPTFVSSRKTKFRYRVDGFREEWVETEDRRVAHFGNLGPGSYVFRVIACNDDGVWSEQEASFPFEIKPHFWQTRWFVTLAILTAVVLGPAVHRYRMMNLARRQRELEVQVAERTAELADANNRLEKLATIDGLTDLANHRHFRMVLRNEWQRHDRSGKPLSILIVDVDHFKLFNDHYGHLEGDRALQGVARVLTAAANRPGDLAARHGGEEFAVVLSETGAEGAREVAERILREINESRIPHATSPVAPHLTVSIGAATIYPSQAASPNTLIGAADDALYEAKEGGRNTIRFARP
jgi:diguanylate cyclase (GGDEF)-like protein